MEFWSLLLDIVGVLGRERGGKAEAQQVWVCEEAGGGGWGEEGDAAGEQHSCTSRGMGRLRCSGNLSGAELPPGTPVVRTWTCGT